MAPREIGKPATGLEIIATATLLQIEGNRFFVTAGHVADLTDVTHLLYPKSDTEAAAFLGQRYRTNPELRGLPPPACNIDIAILPLEDIEIHPRYRFLGEGQLITNGDFHEGIQCVAAGYPSGINRTIRNNIDVKPKQIAFQFPTIEPDRYREYDLDTSMHLAMKYEREVTRTDPKSGKSQKTKLPKLKGISGGPMWIRTSNGYALAAIVSDHPTEKRIVFGTKIDLARKMIYQHLRSRP